MRNVLGMGRFLLISGICVNAAEGAIEIRIGKSGVVVILFGYRDGNGLSTFADAIEMFWNVVLARPDVEQRGLRSVCGPQDGAVSKYLSRLVRQHGANATGI